MVRVINYPANLPVTVDVTDPQALQRTMEQILELLRVWNGDHAPEQRLVTKQELDDATG